MVANGPCFVCCRASTDDVAFFWTSGADGVLRLLRCNDCRFFIHPPGPVCPRCLSRNVAPQAVSGRGQVETFTVNYQQWIPGSDPYIIAWVSIDEQPDVRLTTNLVDVEPEDVLIGMAVEVLFEHVEDVYLPLFTPVTRGGREPRADEEPLERRAIISGIGQSAVGRRLGRTDLDLTVEAALAAIADAGLNRDDIDGLSTYPGMGAGTPGFAGPPTPEVQDALGLSLNWHDGGGEGAGADARRDRGQPGRGRRPGPHVLVYRTVTEGTAQGTGGRQGIGGSGGGGAVPRFGSFMQWSLPYGAVSAANWIAMVGQRRMHEFGLTREQLGQIAINGRRNAALESQGHLHRPDVDGRLPGRPHHHHAAVPLRLRRALRRLHRGDRVAPRCRRRPRPPGRADQRGGHGAAGPAQLGPVRRHDHHGGP